VGHWNTQLRNEPAGTALRSSSIRLRECIVLQSVVAQPFVLDNLILSIGQTATAFLPRRDDAKIPAERAPEAKARVERTPTRSQESEMKLPPTSMMSGLGACQWSYTNKNGKEGERKGDGVPGRGGQSGYDEFLAKRTKFRTCDSEACVLMTAVAVAVATNTRLTQPQIDDASSLSPRTPRCAATHALVSERRVRLLGTISRRRRARAVAQRWWHVGREWRGQY